MAIIILGKSIYPICGDLLKSGNFIATSGCAFSPDHPLWRFCDAGLHFKCLESWSHRIEFAQGYYEMTLKGHKEGYGTLLFESDDWFLASGPPAHNEIPYFVHILLRFWPIGLYSEWERWNGFIKTGFREGLRGEALSAAENVTNQVAKYYPSLRYLEKEYLRSIR